MITADDVCAAVARFYHVDTKALKARSRMATIVRVRHVAMLLCHRKAGMNYTDIGHYFRRDHSSALMGIRKIGLRGGETREQIEYLEKELDGLIAGRAAA